MLATCWSSVKKERLKLVYGMTLISRDALETDVNKYLSNLLVNNEEQREAVHPAHLGRLVPLRRRIKFITKVITRNQEVVGISE